MCALQPCQQQPGAQGGGCRAHGANCWAPRATQGDSTAWRGTQAVSASGYAPKCESGPRVARPSTTSRTEERGSHGGSAKSPLWQLQARAVMWATSRFWSGCPWSQTREPSQESDTRTTNRHLGNSSQRSANTKCPSHVLEYPEYSSWGYSITLHVCFQENTQIWAETHRRNFTVLFVRFTLQLIPGSTRRPPAPDVHFRVRAGYRPARGQRHDSHKIPGDLQA